MYRCFPLTLVLSLAFTLPLNLGVSHPICSHTRPHIHLHTGKDVSAQISRRTR